MKNLIDWIIKNKIVGSFDMRDGSSFFEKGSEPYTCIIVSDKLGYWVTKDGIFKYKMNTDVLEKNKSNKIIAEGMILSEAIVPENY